MGEVLSQNEIDNLLKALNSGEIDVDEIKEQSYEVQVKNYDFARPSKFSKEPDIESLPPIDAKLSSFCTR